MMCCGCHCISGVAAVKADQKPPRPTKPSSSRPRQMAIGTDHAACQRTKRPSHMVRWIGPCAQPVSSCDHRNACYAHEVSVAQAAAAAVEPQSLCPLLLNWQQLCACCHVFEVTTSSLMSMSSAWLVMATHGALRGGTSLGAAPNERRSVSHSTSFTAPAAVASASAKQAHTILFNSAYSMTDMRAQFHA